MGDPVPPMFWLRDPEANVLLVVEVPRVAGRPRPAWDFQAGRARSRTSVSGSTASRLRPIGP